MPTVGFQLCKLLHLQLQLPDMCGDPQLARLFALHHKVDVHIAISPALFRVIVLAKSDRAKQRSETATEVTEEEFQKKIVTQGDNYHPHAKLESRPLRNRPGAQTPVFRPHDNDVGVSAHHLEEPGEVTHMVEFHRRPAHIQ